MRRAQHQNLRRFTAERILNTGKINVRLGRLSEREGGEGDQRGAERAGELDAKRAIDQGSRLAADIERAKPDRVGEYVAPLGMEGWLFQQITSRSKSA